jgi:hypothetical protein
VSLPPLEFLLCYSCLVIRFLLGDSITQGGKLNLEVKPKLGHHPHLEDNPHSEDIIHNPHLDKPMGSSGSLAQYWNLSYLGKSTILAGGNHLKLVLLYPLVWASHTQVLPIPFGVQTFKLVSLFKGTFLNQYNPMGYMPPHTHLNLLGSSHHM